MISPLLRNRDYMLLWGGQVVSTLGSAASSIIYPLLILDLTSSPSAAGVAAALRTVPYLIFSLPVGALIDRWDRKRVMILCDLGRAAVVLTVPIAIWLDMLTIWQLYAAGFLEGSLFVFFNIAEVAALPRVVQGAQLPQAAAQNEAAFGAASIVGPSVGTMFYQTLGRAAPFVADAISYLVSSASLAFIKTDFQMEKTTAAHKLTTEITEGLRWLWRQPLISYMAFLTGGINLVNAAVPLIVIVMAKQLGANDTEIGLIFSIGGTGGIIGSLIGGQVQKRFPFGQVIIFLMWANAVLFPLYALVPQYVFLGVVIALLYLLMPVYNVVQFSYRLALIPDALQGRVNSTFRLLAFGFMPLGAAISGLLLEHVGPVTTILFFSMFNVLLGVLTTFNRHVRQARPLEEVLNP